MVNLCCSRPLFASIPLSCKRFKQLLRGACTFVGPGLWSMSHQSRCSTFPPYKG
ncbi:hypothetical protein HMPREF0591_5188 [Mycobacterium parascrofulaceum ATCC BAA-614]|uniref:Uncharacterized protein n=1 Tax=Mycobacterium parascrofulaceum ATCC BAA-614 TaxID=525368 RepID=D5PG94_9MYCO|nr:hypothetical protein HMPREF0591_5188 [Mycobacterium parascrofulaceum ATCC BAA-614]